MHCDSKGKGCGANVMNELKYEYNKRNTIDIKSYNISLCKINKYTSINQTLYLNQSLESYFLVIYANI
jgi:hypothetical protein